MNTGQIKLKKKQAGPRELVGVSKNALEHSFSK